MRTAVVLILVLGMAACASTPPSGTLGEGAAMHSKITAVDSTYPPRSAWIEMDRAGYAALVLVAPGHSATLLHPHDSLSSNELTAGAHQLTFEIPRILSRADSGFVQPRGRPRDDDRPGAPSTRARGQGGLTPLPPNAKTYLLLVTSPQPLNYQAMLDKTGGVSIPLLEGEALNAVAKAIKSTIAQEPREWTGYFIEIVLRRPQ